MRKFSDKELKILKHYLDAEIETVDCPGCNSPWNTAKAVGHEIKDNVYHQLEHAWASLDGDGVKQDSDEAGMWFRMAAEQGDSSAQNILGMMYERGWWGVSQDYAAAVKWYRVAAEQGDALAQSGR